MEQRLVVPFEKETFEFKVNDVVSFRIRSSGVEAQKPADGAIFTFPPKFLAVIAHFGEWKPLSSLFDECDLAELGIPQLVSFARALIEGGVLVARRPTNGAFCLEDFRDTAEIWSDWGPALGYYLASRTRADQPFISVEDLDVQLGQKALDEPQPSSYKDYLSHGFIALPNPLLEYEENADDSLMAALFDRRTHRDFSLEPLTLASVACLLLLTWGAMAARPNRMGEDVFLRKTSPSGGSLHVTEVYPIILNVDGLLPGVYHYSVRRHGLEQLSGGDPREWIVEACGGQQWVKKSAAVFLSTAVLRRKAWKYRFARAFRTVHLDVGHLSQTFCLVATSLGLAPFSIGAVRDEIFEQKVGLNYLVEPVVFLNGVGRAAVRVTA
jgi:SagB-type dehydrogenase family enzyme